MRQDGLWVSNTSIPKKQWTCTKLVAPKDLAQALVTAGIASNLFSVLRVGEAIPLR
jgi:hypothetical protein